MFHVKHSHRVSRETPSWARLLGWKPGLSLAQLHEYLLCYALLRFRSLSCEGVA